MYLGPKDEWNASHPYSDGDSEEPVDHGNIQSWTLARKIALVMFIMIISTEVAFFICYMKTPPESSYRSLYQILMLMFGIGTVGALCQLIITCIKVRSHRTREEIRQ